MNIFAGILAGIAFGLITLIIGLMMWASDLFGDEPFIIGVVIVAIVVMIAVPCIMTAGSTNKAKVWVAAYEAEKETIESSLEAESLSGLERVELVKRAAELNGELASRATKAGFWYTVYYGGSPYDGVELIAFE